MEMSLAYVAGLIDGEGFIGIHWRRKSIATYYSARLQIGMTLPALPILLELHETWGGSLNRMRPETDKWAEAWIWTVQGNPLLTLLCPLTPHLRIKREQALLAIRLQEAKAALPRHRGNIPLWNPEVEAECAQMKARMHVLNTKGPTRYARIAEAA